MEPLTLGDFDGLPLVEPRAEIDARDDSKGDFEDVTDTEVVTVQLRVLGGVLLIIGEGETDPEVEEVGLIVPLIEALAVAVASDDIEAKEEKLSVGKDGKDVAVKVGVIVLESMALVEEVTETEGDASFVRLTVGDADGLPVDDGEALDERLAREEEDGTGVCVISTLPVLATLSERSADPLTLAV